MKPKKDFRQVIRIRVDLEHVEDTKKHLHIEHMISLPMLQYMANKVQDDVLDSVFRKMIYDLRKKAGWI